MKSYILNKLMSSHKGCTFLNDSAGFFGEFSRKRGTKKIIFPGQAEGIEGPVKLDQAIGYLEY
jgi:hypothetical protein